MWVMSPKKAFTPRDTPVAGEWSKNDEIVNDESAKPIVNENHKPVSKFL
jgi:hypothetical protein